MTDPVNPLSAQRSAERTHDIRRLRDILRANVLNGRYNQSKMPDELDLMTQHGVTRAVIREALVLMRTEGIIDRLQGYGTFGRPSMHFHDDRMTGKVPYPPDSAGWERVSRITVLARREVATPDAVDALMPGTGGRVLLLEYLAQSDNETLGISTGYFRYPEGHALATGSIGTNFWEFIERSNISVGAKSTTFGAVTADAAQASVLGAAVGDPLVTIDEVLFTQDGEPFDVAYLRLRGDRVRMKVFSPEPGYKHPA